jgi:hypothetical protein
MRVADRPRKRHSMGEVLQIRGASGPLVRVMNYSQSVARVIITAPTGDSRDPVVPTPGRPCPLITLAHPAYLRPRIRDRHHLPEQRPPHLRIANPVLARTPEPGTTSKHSKHQIKSQKAPNLLVSSRKPRNSKFPFPRIGQDEQPQETD